MENIRIEYIEFINDLNIYSLNQEIKKIERINENGLSASTWSPLQKKEFISLISYLNNKYPVKDIPTHIKEDNRQIRRQKCNEYRKKVAVENKKYINNKDLYLQLINERKEILMNETKNKEKQKALEEIICECGLPSKRKHIARHRISATHIKLMSITKETPIVCQSITKETPVKEITEKEEKKINKEFEKIIEEEESDIDEESYIDEESDEESDDEAENMYYNKPLVVTEEQEEEFRELYNVKWHTKLIIKKNIEWRKKWYKDNNVLFPIYKLDENGNETKEVIGIC